MNEEQNHGLMRTRDRPSETVCQGIQRTMDFKDEETDACGFLSLGGAKT